MISLLYAAPEAAAPQQGNVLASFFPLILIIVVFYFLLILPQNKRAKEHKKMIDSLKVGDEVVTAAGIYGKIKAIKDNVVELQVSDKTTIKIVKSTISQKVNA